MPFGIDGAIVQPLRLEEDLVAVAVGEAMDLVLDRGAVTRPDAADRAGEKRRAVEVGADDRVGARVGAGDGAEQLRRRRGAASSATSSSRRRPIPAARARAQSMRPPVEPRRRPGLEPRQRQRRARAAGAASAVAAPLADPAAGAAASSPKCSLPPRKVPVASTTACARELAAVGEDEPGDPPARRAAAPPPRPRRSSSPGCAASSRWIAAL